jgi:hypothetical protein
MNFLYLAKRRSINIPLNSALLQQKAGLWLFIA